MEEKKALFEYLLRLGDDSLILGQRLSEWCGHGPILEEDIAMTNIALDLIGQATNLFEYASSLGVDKRSADELAFVRYEKDYRNLLLVEQENTDFGYTLARQFLFDAFRKPFFEALSQSSDQQLAAIAEKSLKETKYHLQHSSEWMIRLGDGTDESHERIQQAVNQLWAYTEEIFEQDQIDQQLIQAGIAVDLSVIRASWTKQVQAVFSEAGIDLPQNTWQQKGGRQGKHTEHMGYLLAEMQFMQRAYPQMEW
ncbi:MAG: phenylacetate-CoA oxygenase subunit PaaI [Bacteroidetes bacterium]|nr:MAG: phenylacetate-CoA oxygenase subunit PaaI [Bacteroidota bacterium]